MAKTKGTKPKEGEQLDLIDVHPKNSKEIAAAARLYKKYQAERQSALVKELEQKTLILELVKKEKLQVLAGGKIKLECGGVNITITPRDELITVKDSVKTDG